MVDNRPPRVKENRNGLNNKWSPVKVNSVATRDVLNDNWNNVWELSRENLHTCNSFFAGRVEDSKRKKVALTFDRRRF